MNFGLSMIHLGHWLQATFGGTLSMMLFLLATGSPDAPSPRVPYIQHLLTLPQPPYATPI